MQLEMRVASLTVDPFTNLPMVILKDSEGGQAIPIWIGVAEAAAIATELEGIKLDRPTPHDLVRSLLSVLGARVEWVEIYDLRSGTFYASIIVARPDSPSLVIEARPSDAIAIAMRTGAAIRVAKDVIDKARHIDLRCQERIDTPGTKVLTACRAEAAGCAAGLVSRRKGTANEPEVFAELLEGLGEAAFGKWKM